MKKLVVMYSENRDNPKNTWSGTSYSLRKALEKKFDIIFIDLHEGKILRLLDLLSIQIGKKYRSYIVGPLHDLLLQVKAKWLLRKYNNIPVLEIANEVKIRNPYYLYQDLSLVVLPEIQSRMKKKGFTSCGGLRMELSDQELERKIDVQKKIYFSVDKAFFMGKWVEHKMKDIYPEISEKFLAVGGGINSEFINNGDEDNVTQYRNIVFVGIDFERKGGPLVVEAFRIVQRKIANAKLIIVGPEKKEIQEKIGRNNKNIEILGNVNRKELSDIFRNAALFCMPSEFEAYGLVFPEAMGFGIPCIGRNSYEMKYFIQDNKNGYLLDSDNAEDLAQIICRALNNKQMKYDVEQQEEEIRKTYSWNRVANEIWREVNKKGQI